jgi:hypothetical protein
MTLSAFFRTLLGWRSHYSGKVQTTIKSTKGENIFVPFVLLAVN